MTRLVSVICIFIFCLQTISQTKDEALRDAKKTAEATLNSDFKIVLKYTYPPILKLMGGKEKALDLITTSMNTMKNSGFEFKSADVISVSEIIQEQNQYRCFVKNNYVMTMNNQKITSEAYLLGIYIEKEKIWSFIEAKQVHNSSIDLVLPDFKTSLNIPKGKL